MSSDRYALGAGDSELLRLDVQSEYYRLATLDAMRWAGIVPGMRVLDIGCGSGGVSFAAAHLVGPTGSVLGMDVADAAIRAAQGHADRLGLRNVRFEQGDLRTWDHEDRFDAVVGRLVLMYLPDPVAALTMLCGRLEPGGVVLIEECSVTGARQVPETMLFRQTLDRVLATFERLGIPPDFGFDLGRIFRAAGLDTPLMTTAGRWEDDGDAAAYAMLAAIVRTVLPAMIAHGVATAADVGIDSLESRLRAAARDAGAGVTGATLISAWCRISADR